jgi:tetratricopeptide (TPR) repeat protein
VGRLKFATVQTVLLAAAFCITCGGLCRAAAGPARSDSSEPNLGQSEQDKTTVLREVALDWILVGAAQCKRGLYEQAEESFLIARGFQEYLTAEEHKQLEEQLDNAHRAAVEKQAVLGHIKAANYLLNQGRPVKARAHYEKVRNSPYLTEQQRKQIAGEIQKVDVTLDKQMKEITELYNRSVELYRAGQLDKAREGFAEVARYGLLVAPEGRSAEDYLVQIDSILTERLKSPSPAQSVPPPVLPIAVPPAKKREDSKPSASPRGEQREQSVQEEAAEVEAVAEPAPAKAEPALDARTKILRTYTKAVVEDTIAQVQRYTIRREFDKAIDAVRKATDIVKKNRSFIGEGSFAQYSVLLKQLVDRIIEARKSS